MDTGLGITRIEGFPEQHVSGQPAMAAGSSTAAWGLQQQQQQQHYGMTGTGPGAMRVACGGEGDASNSTAYPSAFHRYDAAGSVQQQPQYNLSGQAVYGGASGGSDVGTMSASQLQALQQQQQQQQNSNSVISKVTTQLVNTYQTTNQGFQYTQHANPKRALTKPSEGVKNEGFDNEHSDLVLYVSDTLVHNNPSNGTSRTYTIQEMLGQGTFGQVVSCWSEDFGKPVAVKVIKNQPAYYHQARVEIGLLQLLNTRCDPRDERHIVRMVDFFLFRKHLCLVFERLDVNLFELLKRNAFRGLSLSLVQMFLRQLLDSLAVLRDAGIIHCDLKPENILLMSPQSGAIKLIDFGSACFENRTVYSYIQSRFYRSPEVVLGINSYNMAIDVWSLGCVAAELFLGLPLFPGASEFDLLTRITETIGPPPPWLLLESKHAGKYFKRVAVPVGGSNNGTDGLDRSDTGSLDAMGASVPRQGLQAGLMGSSFGSMSGSLGMMGSSVPGPGFMGNARVAGGGSSSSSSREGGQPAGGTAHSSSGQPVQYKYQMLSQAEFEARNKVKATVGKRYFAHTALADIVANYPMRQNMRDEDIIRERINRESFTDFLRGVLDVDPRTRWTPRQAAGHPFVRGTPYRGPYQPQPDPLIRPLVTPPSSTSTPSTTTTSRTPPATANPPSAGSSLTATPAQHASSSSTAIPMQLASSAHKRPAGSAHNLAYGAPEQILGGVGATPTGAGPSSSTQGSMPVPFTPPSAAAAAAAAAAGVPTSATIGGWGAGAGGAAAPSGSAQHAMVSAALQQQQQQHVQQQALLGTSPYCGSFMLGSTPAKHGGSGGGHPMVAAREAHARQAAAQQQQQQQDSGAQQAQQAQQHAQQQALLLVSQAAGLSAPLSSSAGHAALPASLAATLARQAQQPQHAQQAQLGAMSGLAPPALSQHAFSQALLAASSTASPVIATSAALAATQQQAQAQPLSAAQAHAIAMLAMQQLSAPMTTPPQQLLPLSAPLSAPPLQGLFGSNAQPLLPSQLHTSLPASQQQHQQHQPLHPSLAMPAGLPPSLTHGLNSLTGGSGNISSAPATTTYNPLLLSSHPPLHTPHTPLRPSLPRSSCRSTQHPHPTTPPLPTLRAQPLHHAPPHLCPPTYPQHQRPARSRQRIPAAATATTERSVDTQQRCTERAGACSARASTAAW